MAEGRKRGDVNVIVAMDGSEHAENALHWYMENLYMPNHHVTVLHCPEYHHVNSATIGLDSTGVDGIAWLLKQEEKEERELLDQLAQKLKSNGIGGRVKSVSGHPGASIVKVAEEERAMMIVIGSRGMSTVRRTLLGGVSDYVSHHSHVPVIVCRNKHSHKSIGQER